MSLCRLCRIKRANTPFYLNTIGVNAYSLEELCYYIVNYPILLDETFYCSELAVWVREELGLPGLGRSLERAMEEELDATAFVEAILREDNYLDAAMARAFSATWVKQSRLSAESRLKKKGDALVKCGKPSAAINVYESLLQNPEAQLSDEMKASVYHNKGVAAIRLLEYRQALADLEKAWSLSHSGDNLRAYLLAYALCKPRAQYEEEIKRLGVDPKTAELIEQELREAAENVAYPPIPDKEAYLASITSDYHRQTGV
ncbi:MAG: hypothetical protein KBS83_08855 [Lachnospiraceae bacterium]|nr:hypothetical protein [Candidatus Equihabitans merdae]